MRRLISLRTRLTLAILLVVLLTVVLAGFLANILIGRQFTRYIATQQSKRTVELVSLLQQQYQPESGTWNTDFIHAIGMVALYDGYIIKVSDAAGKVIWDAQAHDMSLCMAIMDDISTRMNERYPLRDGAFATNVYHLNDDLQRVGLVEIIYYGPFFLSENDFTFLGLLNTIIIIIAAVAFILAMIVGTQAARRFARPILQTVEAAGRIAGGQYDIRLQDSVHTREIHLLTESINHLGESLSQQESLRRQLTSDVAHELRTPLTTLQTHMEAMIDGIWEPTIDRLKSSHEEIKRLGTLVKDLEQLARTDSDLLRLEKTEVNLTSLVTTVIDSFDAQFLEKNLTVTFNGTCRPIQADRDRLSQVVINLLANAVKFTQPGGSISVELRNAPDGNKVQMIFTDTGIGISEAEQAAIFERFYRADKSRNRMTGGSGIGLAIVKSIVLAHGGTVTVASQVGKGSTFTVTLSV